MNFNNITTSLRRILLDLREPSVLPDTSVYISDSDLVEHVSIAEIKHVLQQSNVGSDEVQVLAEQIQSNSLKTFGILILLDAADHVTEFMKTGFTDAQLPVELYGDGLRSIARTLPNTIWKVGESSENLLRLFTETQWMFLCPSFHAAVKHQTFDARTVLPFARKQDRQWVSDQGWIEVVTIDPKHFSSDILRLVQQPLPQGVSLNHPQPQPHIHTVVLKCHRRKKVFETENRMLLACLARKHEHVISLITSFSSGELNYLVLPLATMDLAQLWTVKCANSGSEETIPWMLRQTTGLVDALWSIHNKLWDGPERLYGLHGDIKASNVLVFGTNDNSFGVLKWTDFSMSVLCKDQETVDRIAPVASIGTHEPPECHLKRNRSQKSDMWALGCLILEFIIWSTDGITGLKEFDRARVQTDHGYDFKFVNDYFFSFASPSTLEKAALRTIERVNSGVVQFIQELRPRVQHKSLHHVLDLVEHSLLQVDPQERITAEECYQAFEQITNG